VPNAQSFYKFYIVPGLGYATPNGSANPAAQPPSEPPLYRYLTEWVENGKAPGRIDIQTPANAKMKITQPVCPYPQKTRYVSGDPKVASSFSCV